MNNVEENSCKDKEEEEKHIYLVRVCQMRGFLDRRHLVKKKPLTLIFRETAYKIYL